MCHPSVMW